MTSSTRAGAFISAFAAWLVLGAPGLAGQAPARAFLTSTFNLTKADYDRLDAGHVVTRTLEASDDREVVTLGVVRIKITPEFYVERLEDIVSFKKNEAVLQIGTFGNLPVVADMAAMTLDDYDVRSLRRCRAGDCGVQLSAGAIAKFQKSVDWRQPNAHQQAEQLLRQTLVEYVTAYMKAGSSAAIEYADESERINSGREWTSLMGPDVPGWKMFPALRQYLLDYPTSDVPGTIDRLVLVEGKGGAPDGRERDASGHHARIGRHARRLRDRLETDLRDALFRFIAWPDDSRAGSAGHVARDVRRLSQSLSRGHLRRTPRRHGAPYRERQGARHGRRFAGAASAAPREAVRRSPATVASALAGRGLQAASWLVICLTCFLPRAVPSPGVPSSDSLLL